MLTKINKIKDFGVFKNITGANTPEFKTFNLIYGWNYSGKTTLSRIFRCLEKSQLHTDYLSATFEFQGDPTTVYTHIFALNPNIRVFNSDFIKENLKWDSDEFEPIFLLGAANIQLQTELKTKTENYDKEVLDIETAKKSNRDQLAKINQALTNKAREISTLLSLGRTFDRDKLKQVVEATIVSDTNFKLSDGDFNKYKVHAISNEQKPLIGQLQIAITKLQLHIDNAQSTLSKQLITSNKIEKLLDNKVLSDWVEIGKNLHADKKACEFCGNNLPHDLLARLNEHFSQDYENLKADIDIQLQKLQSITVSIQSPADTAFYADLVDESKVIKKSFENELSVFNNTLLQLKFFLNKKKEKPFDNVELPTLSDNSEALGKVLVALNDLINQNDKRTSEFATEKSRAIQKLKEHFGAVFEETEKYSITINSIEKEEKSIEQREKNNQDLSQNIILIKSQLDDTVKGAVKINDHLKVFFGKDDIQISPTPQKKFKLSRGNDLAKNLSEGEKTAIAFAYFITKLEEQNNTLADTIVYIDDPVSSLDANHLFNIYSFIKSTFYEFSYDATQGKNIHKEKCKQLFISTHNFDFHNLIYDWFKERNIGKNKQAFFIVERQKNIHKDESTIKQNSNLITQFNSEYAYLYSLLNAFLQNPVDTNESLYHLPNIARRFIETFLNFKYMSPYSIEEKIGQLITNAVDCERARKFMHYHSHSLTTDKFVKYADLSECQAVIDILIKAVQNNDPIHYSSLQNAIATV